MRPTAFVPHAILAARRADLLTVWGSRHRFLAVHPLLKLCAGAEHMAFQCTGGNPQLLRCFVIRYTLNTNHEQNKALIGGQTLHMAPQVLDQEIVFLAAAPAQMRGWDIIQIHHRPISADVGEEAIAENTTNPGAKVCSNIKAVLGRERAHDGCLDKVLGVGPMARKRHGLLPKRRKRRQKQSAKLRRGVGLVCNLPVKHGCARFI